MQEVRLGNIYGEDKGTGFAGNVWDKNGISPALTTMQGGGREPMIVEVGHIEKGTGKHQSNVVYDSNGIAPTLCAGMGVKQQPTMHIETQIVAMRGRDPENPSDRTPGNPNLEQRLEPNAEGICNTITTVQKDNMVLECKPHQLGFIEHGTGQHQSNTVYDTDAISPGLTTVNGGGTQQVKIVEIKQATKQGTIPCEIGGVADLNYPTSQTRRGRVQGNGQISPTLTTTAIPSVLERWTWEIDGVTYLIRIRKLTPKECWRLMDFTDEDFEKAAAVNSNTQLYKQAGNSIVKNVLCEVFKQML